jgi:GTP cyclohydrolase II
VEKTTEAVLDRLRGEEVMIRVHFKDDGQDVLWWDIDEKGIVQLSNLQNYFWAATKVIGTSGGGVFPDIKVGEKLLVIYGSGRGGEFIHPVVKVEVHEKRSKGEKSFS